MMRLRQLLSAFLLGVMALSLSAKPVELAEARQVANDYLSVKASRHIHGVAAARPQLRLAHVAKASTGANDYYVFNNGEDNGYIVVAGDDLAVPVLGYCDHGAFDPDAMPNGLACLLETYAGEMSYLRAHPNAAKAQAPVARNPVVKPLLPCKWGQGAPFNDLCPEYVINGSTVKTVTGCVATAAAQVMYYYRWPKRGTGSNTYNWKNNNNAELSGEYDHEYYWEDMLDSYTAGNYTDVQAGAVAQLLYDVGTAASMNYGRTSSTPVYKVMTALKENFFYNKGMDYVLRASKTITQWEDIIFDELNDHCPIIYSGFTESGGHTFVLDGYNADGYFHFNWGWNSLSDGYFVITALNPREQGIGSYSGGYNSCQSIIINIYPDEGGTEPEPFFEVVCDSFTPDPLSADLGETISVEVLGLSAAAAGYGNYVPFSLALALTDADNRIVKVLHERSFNIELGSRYTYDDQSNRKMQITPETGLAEGDYRLQLMYKCETAGINEYIPNASLFAGYWLAHVEGGKIKFSKPRVSNHALKVVKLDYPERVSDNSYFKFTLTLANEGEEFYGDIDISTKKEGDPDYQILFSSLIDLDPGREITISGDIFAPRGSGTYDLVLRDEVGDIVGEHRTLIVEDNEGYVLEPASQLATGSYYMYPQKVTATIDVLNSGTHDFLGPIHYQVKQNATVRLNGYTEQMRIPAGEKRTIKMETALEGQKGVVYTFAVQQLKQEPPEAQAKTVADFELIDPVPAVTLANMLAYGEDGESYNVLDDLTVVDALRPSLFVTDGLNNWLEVVSENDFDALTVMEALKAGTYFGTLNVDVANCSSEPLWLPKKGDKREITVDNIVPADGLELMPQQVIDLSGYLAVTDDGATSLNAAADGSGSGIEVSFEWLTTPPTVDEGRYYTLRGVVRYLDATRIAVYALREPVETSSIGTVAATRPTVNLDGNRINVTGASRVAVYNTAGALVTTAHTMSLPAGFYIVVADGISHKLVVK